MCSQNSETLVQSGPSTSYGAFLKQYVGRKGKLEIEKSGGLGMSCPMVEFTFFSKTDTHKPYGKDVLVEVHDDFAVFERHGMTAGLQTIPLSVLAVFAVASQ